MVVVTALSQSVPIGGIVIRRGQQREIPLARFGIDAASTDDQSIIKSGSHLKELERLVKSGLVTATVDGIPLSRFNAAVVDAPAPDNCAGLVRDVFNAPATASNIAIKTAAVAPAAATTYSGALLNGAIGNGDLTYPRNIRIYGATGMGEALLQKTVVVTGVDVEGVERSESIVCAALGASLTQTTDGVLCFKRITSIYVPADLSAPAGDYSFGFGNRLGFSHPLTMALPIQFVANVKVTNGTVAYATTSAPNGAYIPNAGLLPNASRNYVLAYVPGG
jgi:hypothetical protein